MRFEYSAGAVIYSYRGGKRMFLFLKREGNWYETPKGHIEKGETEAEAAAREITEESGLNVVLDTGFKHSSSWWFKDGKAKVKKTTIYFIARVQPDAKAKVSKEHIGYKWMAFSEYTRTARFENLRVLLKAANEYIDKKELMERLNDEYRKLPSKIKGWSLSRNFVAGEGPLDAKVVLVGQAPGRNEDETGRPFIGISGQLLGRLLNSAGLNREQVYITSVVQFFPPKNRVPSDAEITECRKFLRHQLSIIKPKLVIIVGAVALRELLAMGEIMKLHGNLIKRDRSYFITLHPAAAIRIKSNMPLIESDFKKLKGALSGL